MTAEELTAMLAPLVRDPDGFPVGMEVLVVVSSSWRVDGPSICRRCRILSPAFRREVKRYDPDPEGGFKDQVTGERLKRNVVSLYCQRVEILEGPHAGKQQFVSRLNCIRPIPPDYETGELDEVI